MASHGPVSTHVFKTWCFQGEPCRGSPAAQAATEGRTAWGHFPSPSRAEGRHCPPPPASPGPARVGEIARKSRWQRALGPARGAARRGCGGVMGASLGMAVPCFQRSLGGVSGAPGGSAGSAEVWRNRRGHPRGPGWGGGRGSLLPRLRLTPGPRVSLGAGGDGRPALLCNTGCVTRAVCDTDCV